jgi:hypothetical protein
MIKKVVSDALPDAGAPKPACSLAYYDFYKENGSDTTFYCTGPSMTRQEFADDCDINNLMKKYENQDIGAIMRKVGEPVYYDFQDYPPDMMSAMAVFKSAGEAFMTLPARVRREFDNDPAMFYDFASNPENISQMREWGLARPLETPPAATPAVPPVANPLGGSATGGAPSPSTHGST